MNVPERNQKKEQGANDQLRRRRGEKVRRSNTVGGGGGQICADTLRPRAKNRKERRAEGEKTKGTDEGGIG